MVIRHDLIVIHQDVSVTQADITVKYRDVTVTQADLMTIHRVLTLFYTGARNSPDSPACFYITENVRSRDKRTWVPAFLLEPDMEDGGFGQHKT